GDEAATRRALRHVEIVASADRVLAMILALTGAGLLGTGMRHVFVFSGTAVLWVGAFLLWKLGARVRAFHPGSRAAQVTAALLVGILYSPVGTALAVYGLATLTSEAARRVFREREMRRGFGPFRYGAAAPLPPPPPPIDGDFERRWPGRAAVMRHGRPPGAG